MKTFKVASAASPNDLAPPSHLSERAQKIWSSVVPRRGRSPERLTLLRVALEALDRADFAAAEIAKEGMVATTKRTGAIHIHPLVRVERESRQLFSKLWVQLHLEWCFDVDGRMQ